MVYGANRNLTFDTRQDVAEYYQEKNDLDPADLYFFEDYKDFQWFFTTDTLRFKSLPYYGIAVNDSLMVDDRADVTTSCVGVSASYMAAYDGGAATVPNTLKGVKLTNIKGEQLSFNSAEPTVVLLGHSNFGRALKSDLKYYKEVAATTGKSFRYVVVAIDVPRSDYAEGSR